MRRALSGGMVRRVTLAACGVMLAAPAPATAGGFAYGVAVGDVTPTSAIIWTRAPHAGAVRVLAYDDSAAIPTLVSDPFVTRRVTAAADLTVRVTLTGLRPGHSYLFRFVERSSASGQGVFSTPPLASRNAIVRFAVAGGFDAPVRASQRGLYPFGIISRMVRAQNTFNVLAGGTIMTRSSQPGAPTAVSLAAKWARYRQFVATGQVMALRRSGAVFGVWSDQEITPGFATATNGARLLAAARDAYLAYVPAPYGRLGLYRTLRWGRNVEVFLLDLESFRSAIASQTASCANPATGLADLAPTAPGPVRAALAATGQARLGSLAQPAPAACAARIAAADRTMLGQAQFAALTRALRASTARFKVVVSTQPLSELLVDPYDRWEGYAAQRAALVTSLAQIPNLVVISTGGFTIVSRARAAAFGPAPASTIGVSEVAVGPAAAASYATRLQALVGSPRAASLLTMLLFAPPTLVGTAVGIGAVCVNTHTPAYAEVTVSATRLVASLRDANGQPVRNEATGAACQPLVRAFAP
jgi:alkaline phosphatase D